MGVSFRAKPSPVASPPSTGRAVTTHKTTAATTRATAPSKRSIATAPAAATATANAAAVASGRTMPGQMRVAAAVVRTAVTTSTAIICAPNQAWNAASVLFSGGARKSISDRGGYS